MARNGYSLGQVAELLGVSKRTLQRRMQEGAFPGRYLSHGRRGLEVRIPSAEVEEAVQRVLAQRRRRVAAGSSGVRQVVRSRDMVARESGQRSGRGTDDPRAATPGEIDSERRSRRGRREREARQLVKSGGEFALTVQAELEELRAVTISILREEQERFLEIAREAMSALRRRDREMEAVKDEVGSVRRNLQALREGLLRVEERLSLGSAESTEGEAVDREGSVDCEEVLAELSALEAFVRGQ